MQNFDMELTQKYIHKYFKADKYKKSEIIKSYCDLTKVKPNTAVQRFNRAKRNIKPRVLNIKSKPKRGRKKVILSLHKSVIKKAWELSGCICAERLHPQLSINIDALIKNGKIKNLTEEHINISKNISLGSLKLIIKGFPRPRNSKHKSGNFLYEAIPIYPEFGKNTDKPGYLEIDYVEHCGENSSGTFAITGNYVCIFSQWVSRSAGLGKSLKSVKSIDLLARNKIYHTIHKTHTDNCKAILKHLYSQAASPQEAKECISRSRPYEKNDNAHVEQKNDDKVRKVTGYFRYDTPKEVELLNDLYDVEDMITNFFTPSMKLIAKEYNDKGKVTRKTYDKAKTPYQRLLESDICEEEKNVLRSLYELLDLVELREKSDIIRQELERVRKSKLNDI